MPLSTLRLNHAPSSHPNDRIVFIKPLPRPPAQSADYQTADNLLRAIAAQCLPIMKSHYLSVTTLEEHEPNPEFIGRNFNNGEIIQLVLRSKNGGWLSVNMIQMVMMHELAHNQHMNHSRKFWETRNLFASEMRALWAKGYTGEGFWGSGRILNELGHSMIGNTVGSEELKDLPLCGGTFRSRRRKRKIKNDGLTWREKKERRIEKKFGKNGVALGEDEDKRLSLELDGKGPIGVKPRVAQSKRGRELRAAAALARFDTNKREVEGLKKEDTDTQSEDDYEDADVDQEDAKDVDGRKLLDSKGHGMVKVCDDEDTDDINVKQEIAELEGLGFDTFETAHSQTSVESPVQQKTKSRIGTISLYDIPQHQDEPSPSNSGVQHNHEIVNSKPRVRFRCSQPPRPRQPSSLLPPARPSAYDSSVTSTNTPITITTTQPKTTSCPICSLSNPSQSPTCTACGHVLDRRKDPRSWTCASAVCQQSGSGYANAGDAGVCGICGARKPEQGG